jgi:hypothetical protein
MRFNVEDEDDDDIMHFFGCNQLNALVRGCNHVTVDMPGTWWVVLGTPRVA